MRKTIFLLVCALTCNIQMFSQTIAKVDYFLNNPELGGDAIIKKSTNEVVGNNAIISFEVEVPVAGEYYANFWMFPAKLRDGSFARYSVSVNGNILADKIIPTVGDWQDITLSERKRISLCKGINTIAVIGVIPNIPNVEHIKLSLNLKDAKIDDTRYNSYKSTIKQFSAQNAAKNALVATTPGNDTLSVNEILGQPEIGFSVASTSENPLYAYEYYSGLNISYTFYTKVYFTEGSQIFVATNGVDNFAHVLEMFSYSLPFDYSWSSMSNENCMASLNITIPATGNYYIRVRSYKNGHKGLCNLNINGENYYENIPVFSVGLRSIHEKNKNYNTFTCNSSTDPVIWMEEGSGTPGKIYAFNNNYPMYGNFYWGSNARVKRLYRRDVHAVLLSTSSSNYPNGKCDVYMKCKVVGTMSSFPNLLIDDIIQSAPNTWQYNCISWSGAITSYWEWPLDTLSAFYSPNPLTAFDNFYASRGLTRIGATENNGVVALWAIVDSIGNRDYTHASVRKGADSNMHGYDWESKAGANIRLFHPRNDLSGPTYGQIVEYYIKNTASPVSAKTIEEEIADGTARIEYINFTSEEQDYLLENIQTVSNDIVQQFNILYEDWKKVIENSAYSNPEQMASCQEYRSVLAFCNSHHKLLYLLYNKIGEGDFAATKLIADLTFDKNASAIKRVRESALASSTRSGIKTIRPLLSNYTAYVKELLSVENESLARLKKQVNAETGISYSNLYDFEVAPSHVDFSLNSPARVSLVLLDLSGKAISVIVNDTLLDSDNYTYQIPLINDGVYLVQLIINGHVNIKKVYNNL